MAESPCAKHIHSVLLALQIVFAVIIVGLIAYISDFVIYFDESISVFVASSDAITLVIIAGASMITTPWLLLSQIVYPASFKNVLEFPFFFMLHIALAILYAITGLIVTALEIKRDYHKNILSAGVIGLLNCIPCLISALLGFRAWRQST